MRLARPRSKLPEFIEMAIGYKFDVEEAVLDRHKLELRPFDDAGKAEPADGSCKEFGVRFARNLDTLAISAQKTHTKHMATERSGAVVVLAVNVVGDRAAYCHESRARRD